MIGGVRARDLRGDEGEGLVVLVRLWIPVLSLGKVGSLLEGLWEVEE